MSCTCVDPAQRSFDASNAVDFLVTAGVATHELRSKKRDGRKKQKQSFKKKCEEEENRRQTVTFPRRTMFCFFFLSCFFLLLCYLARSSFLEAEDQIFSGECKDDAMTQSAAKMKTKERKGKCFSLSPVFKVKQNKVKFFKHSQDLNSVKLYGIDI